MSDARVPADLLRQVARDLRPVRPLASPARRALLLVPVGLLLLLFTPLVWGWRTNLPQFASSWLGLAATWGLSGLQALAGLLIAGGALREAVPGRSLPAAAFAAAGLLALTLLVGVTLLTHALLPTVTPPGYWLQYVWECAGTEMLSALPGLALVAWLASRALPPRPALAGALYGLGAGVMTDAGMRLYCALSEPAHVLVAHGGAILAIMMFGAIVSVLIERVRRR